MRSVVLVLLSVVLTASAWDEADFEVFDVVEEVNQNFYELLGVKQDALPSEIKSAFKKLTLKLHPDKNDAPDADVQFRNLVSVHNVLKDPGKREKYIGLAEGAIILFILITLGQYAVGWAAYVEKRFTASKKSGFDAGLAEILEQLPKPSIKDTLPCQIPRLMWWMVTAIPRAAAAAEAKERGARRRRAFLPQAREPAACLLDPAHEPDAPPEPKRYPGGAPDRWETIANCMRRPLTEVSVYPIVSGGLWTDDDLAELVRLVKRYPGGAPDRWETIANCMRRPLTESDSVGRPVDGRRPAELVRLVKRYPGGAPDRWETIANCMRRPLTEVSLYPIVSGGLWTDDDLAELVRLVKRYAGGAPDRWETIANCMRRPLTEEECMQRCKYLSDLVRKQKQKEEEEKEQAAEEPQRTEEPLIEDDPQSDQELEVKPKK
ncbi:DnaJ-26, partial [Operophtera brumata]